MIALDAKMKPTATDDPPRVLAYQWGYDEDVTQEMIAECADAAADFYNLADPVWYVDHDRIEQFDDRPEATRLMTEARSNDCLILSFGAAPVLIDFCDLMAALLQQGVDVNVVESDGNVFAMDEELLYEYRKILYDACFKKTRKH